MALKIAKPFYLLLGLFFLLNLLQSSFTQLLYDEAYYWYYAQNLAWGYFDHPPMIALMIKVGITFFKTELGVRLVSIILLSLTSIILWQLVDAQNKQKNIGLFFLLLFSLPLLNAYSFLSLPDTPLLFFSTLFLWWYKKFLHHESYALAVALGFTLAAMMYSKYHAALIILFTIGSNPRILTNKKAWLAVGISLILYVPHLIWLYNNEWVSLIFHIFERPNQPYSFNKFTLAYLLNTLIIFGLVFPWVYWALASFKVTDKFKRALVFIIYGFLVFFFISSFNRRTQAQWLITICVPLFIITFNHLCSKPKAKKAFFVVGIVSTVLVLYLRAWLIYQPLLPKVFETHYNKDFANRLSIKVQGLPVVFENKYARAAMYTFYTGQPSYSMNNFHYRKNQYSIDSAETYIQNKKVAYVSKYYPAKNFTIPYRDGSLFKVSIFDNFKSYRKLNCLIEQEILPNTQQLQLQLINPYTFNVPTATLDFKLAYLNKYKQLKEQSNLTVTNKLPPYIESKDTIVVNLLVDNPLFKNHHYIRVGIKENETFPGINSQSYPISANHN